MQLDDVQGLPRLVVPAFVEHAVVGQVVLELGSDDLALVEHGGGVARADIVRVEIADIDRQGAAATVGKALGEFGQRPLRGSGEGLTQGEVLDGIAGQCHLGEHHEMRAPLGGLACPLDDQVGVPGQVTDPGVDLSGSDAQLRHVVILPHVFASEAEMWRTDHRRSSHAATG